MEINTDEELFSHLDEELAWRKRELSYIKYLIDTTSPTNLDFNLRIGVIFLYAHWQGYVNIAARYFVMYVKSQNLKYEELSDNLITASLKQEFVRCWNTRKAREHHRIVNVLLNKLNDVAILHENNAIQTGSNLDYDTFCEVIFTIGLDPGFYEAKEHLIDDILLDKRHHIAHGDRNTVDKDEYLQLHKEIILMLDSFHQQIIDSATTQSYKKENITHPTQTET